MTHPGEYHGNPGRIGSIDHFLIADRATRLDHGNGACGNHAFQPIGEGEERVGRSDRTLSQRDSFTSNLGSIKAFPRRDAG